MKAKVTILWRLLLSPVVFIVVMLFCAIMMSLYAFVTWPLTGHTVIKIGWEKTGDDMRGRALRFFAREG